MYQPTTSSTVETLDNLNNTNLRDPRLQRVGHPTDPRSKKISDFDMDTTESALELNSNPISNETNTDKINDTLKKDLLLSEIVNNAVRESREILTKEANKLGNNTGLSFFEEMSSIFNDSNVCFLTLTIF